MAVNLGSHQLEAIDKLKSGSILNGGVGSGKSRTAIAYYLLKECQGNVKINGKGDFSEMKKPKDLYIITTAKKRDSLEWEQECTPFMISTKPELSISGVKLVVDSWNNISKYKHITNAFFIFDEQRLIGSGTWVKSFIKISRSNKWILLSATPGDTWTDYIPVFIANKFYTNRTEFLRIHAVYSRYTKYPKIEKFIETGRLNKQRNDITVMMPFNKTTISNNIIINLPFDEDKMNMAYKKRWNIYKDKPISAAGELCYVMRRIVNSDPSRLFEVKLLIKKHPKLIIFYNFDYELNILKSLESIKNLYIAEWNGHKHDSVPKCKKWIYLVQYTAGAEGWNCIDTNAMIFYSQNYSYKIINQAAGRIDRMNTPFTNLYYYHLKSKSIIDIAISKSLKNKQNFNIEAIEGSK